MYITIKEIDMDDFIGSFLKMIGGIVTITVVVSYFLAVIFSPFGIVYLVLTN